MASESTDRGSVQVDVGPSKSLSTPRLILHSKSGAVPYLNYNFISKNNGILYRESTDHQQPELLAVNVADLLDLLSNKSLEQLRSLPYLKDFSMMITLHDPLITSYQNLKSTVDSIPVFTHHGKKMVTVPKLISIACQSDALHCQSLADINTPPTAGKKWTAKSASRSNKFLEDTLNRKNETSSSVKLEETKRIKLNGELNEKLQVWATVAGGYSVHDRLESCRAITANADKLSGVIIDAFYGYHSSRDGDILEAVDSFDVASDLLLQTILPNLPTHLPRYLTGSFLPDDICRAIDAGIDLIDSSIGTILTQKGIALPSPLIDLDTVQLRYTRQSSPSASFESDGSPISALNLAADEYTRANVTISKQCACYTCTNNYSRAYINHLLRRKELNGSMLLQIHNHFALSQFFTHLRHLMAKGQLRTLLVNSGISPCPKMTVTPNGTITQLENGTADGDIVNNQEIPK